MRLWSLHPEHLDTRGLVALWRESLLAQAVLRGRTKGYKHHPQLIRFRGSGAPLGSIAAYLRVLQREAERRGYAFDARKIGRSHATATIPVTHGQVRYAWRHLRTKLALRDRAWLAKLARVERPEIHPVFRAVPGGVESWEAASRARGERGASASTIPRRDLRVGGGKESRP